MWIVVGMANTHSMAKQMQQVLEVEGILVKIRNASANSKATTYEILVLESEADSAREILIENGL